MANIKSQIKRNKQNKKAQNADEDENDLDVEGKSDAHLMATEEDLDEEEDDESMHELGEHYRDAAGVNMDVQMVL